MSHGLFYRCPWYLLSMEGQRALRFHKKYINLCSKHERRSYGFGMTWGWVINDIIFFFGWTNPLTPWMIGIVCLPLQIPQRATVKKKKKTKEHPQIRPCHITLSKPNWLKPVWGKTCHEETLFQVISWQHLPVNNIHELIRPYFISY